MNSATTCFSLISLVLSIFGGTYVAISAVKMEWDAVIQKIKEKCNDIGNQIAENCKGQTEAENRVKDCSSKINSASFWYKWSQYVPIIGFVLFSFGMAVYCSFFMSAGDEVATSIQCNVFKVIQIISLLLNFGCLLSSSIATKCIIKNGKQLEADWLLIKQVGNIDPKAVARLNPPAIQD